MKFDIFDRFSGAVQFTAEIECAENTTTSIKIGLAVKWAVKNRANLDGASLDGASLNGANLDGANLDGANLNGASLDGASLNRASLSRASLNRANLNGASLNRASLSRANLSRANLNRANLDGASLDGANLSRASLSRASLNRANLNGASLNRANLSRASLNGASGINDFVKSMQIDTYPICYTAENIQIGCQRHTHAEWAAFSDAQIHAMDDERALEWWGKYKVWIFQTIELCPAKPTGYVEATQ